MRTLSIDIWSDVVCPWCYIGKRRIEGALASFPHKDAVQVRWHAFELDPSAPKNSGTPVREMLARKYRMGPTQVQAMQDRVEGVAAEVGVQMHIERTAVENTFDAHRLIAHAGEQGLGGVMKERLLAAYFTEGRRIGDHAVLAALAAEVGVTGAAEALGDPAAFSAAVRKDEAEARELGITGVPFFVIDGRFGISGGQPEAVFRGALDRAWAEGAQEETAAGPACDADGCALPK
jgi:predicted DsbA family dithiol-disulfide isomerase